MTTEEYQEAAVSFAQYGGNAMYPALGLAEEAGEVAGKIAKFIRKNDGMSPKQALSEFPNALGDANAAFRDDLRKELGDVCWMVAVLAHEFGIGLSDVMEANIAKLADRRERGVIVGEGDNR